MPRVSSRCVARRVRIGHVLGPAPFADWLRAELASGPFREAPLTWAVAIESRRISLPHEDPADRFLAATARVHGLTLVTADARLAKLKDVDMLAVRSRWRWRTGDDRREACRPALAVAGTLNCSTCLTRWLLVATLRLCERSASSS